MFIIISIIISKYFEINSFKSVEFVRCKIDGKHDTPCRLSCKHLSPSQRLLLFIRSHINLWCHQCIFNSTINNIICIAGILQFFKNFLPELVDLGPGFGAKCYSIVEWRFRSEHTMEANIISHGVEKALVWSKIELFFCIKCEPVYLPRLVCLDVVILDKPAVFFHKKLYNCLFFVGFFFF